MSAPVPCPSADVPVLLHCCCAPCASACVERLLEEGRKVMLYYSNSNINTPEEFEKRLACVERLAGEYHLEYAADPYDHEAWLRHVRTLEGYDKYPEGGARCALCFEYNLGRAASFALARGMHFTTSLTVSPHKNSRLIFSVASKWHHFEAYDFKKKDGFKRSIELACRLGFYRQDFCGCEFSFVQRQEYRLRTGK